LEVNFGKAFHTELITLSSAPDRDARLGVALRSSTVSYGLVAENVLYVYLDGLVIDATRFDVAALDFVEVEAHLNNSVVRNSLVAPSQLEEVARAAVAGEQQRRQVVIGDEAAAAAAASATTLGDQAAHVISVSQAAQLFVLNTEFANVSATGPLLHCDAGAALSLFSSHLHESSGGESILRAVGNCELALLDVNVTNSVLTATKPLATIQCDMVQDVNEKKKETKYSFSLQQKCRI
jgi:hypothetical protein